MLTYVSIWPIGLDLAFNFAYVRVNADLRCSNSQFLLMYMSSQPIVLDLALNFASVHVNLADQG